MECYLSQNDYPRFLFLLKEIETVCFFITQEHFCSRFLYYFCLCKSFKELFLQLSISRKRVQRYNYFRNQQNFSQIFFSFLMIIFRLLIRINYRNDTHLIILYIEGMLISDKRFAFPTFCHTFAHYYKIEGNEKSKNWNVGTSQSGIG